MTDKQIIDKCPISEKCKEFENCKIQNILQQLKAKEQENKNFREDIKDIANLLDLDTGEEYNFGNIELEIKQLKAKEQECEELTTINARLLGRLEVDETDTSLVFNLDKELRQKEKEFYTAIQKVVKLKQTLTEIKEIVYGCLMSATRQKILEKISECEGKND